MLIRQVEGGIARVFGLRKRVAVWGGVAGLVHELGVSSWFCFCVVRTPCHPIPGFPCPCLFLVGSTRMELSRGCCALEAGGVGSLLEAWRRGREGELPCAAGAAGRPHGPLEAPLVVG